MSIYKYTIIPKNINGRWYLDIGHKWPTVPAYQPQPVPAKIEELPKENNFDTREDAVSFGFKYLMSKGVDASEIES